uniref:Uncharacterized protein n=1 Tax=Micrurus corallinus TaxID=54390 RepID=A0A2D4FGR2_MICCO
MCTATFGGIFEPLYLATSPRIFYSHPRSDVSLEVLAGGGDLYFLISRKERLIIPFSLLLPCQQSFLRIGSFLFFQSSSFSKKFCSFPHSIMAYPQCSGRSPLVLQREFLRTAVPAKGAGDAKHSFRVLP